MSPRTVRPTEAGARGPVAAGGPLAPSAEAALRSGVRVEVVFADGVDDRLGVDERTALLDELRCSQQTGGWWFTRQEATWHLHIDREQATALRVVLDRFVDCGSLSRWELSEAGAPWPGHPAPFAGDAGLGAAILAFHRVDSLWVLAYLRQAHPLLGARHVAGILAGVICGAAGLDRTEAADVLDVLAQCGGMLDDSARTRVQGLTGMLSTFLRVSPGALLGPEGDAGGWVSGLALATQRLRERSDAQPGLTGRDQREERLRDVLGHVLTAQWGRLGLTPADRTILAVATRDALRTTRRAP